ncbi:hypothetical protein [Burkholderia vietnamiensis]|uniref:hypothetical protein n=1 Tax=Burkholderia vietnamiensis TaxID=60552 RepID=UPI0012D9C161|nr:hypothetical protein [Burkholderia vietnamiensis]
MVRVKLSFAIARAFWPAFPRVFVNSAPAEIGKKDDLALLCERAVAAAHGDDAARQFTPKYVHERRQPKIAAGGPW